MLRKVYIALNAFEQALAILNLFDLQMQKKNICLSEASLCFLAVEIK